MSLLGHPLCRLLGFNPTGDLADLTFYTDRRKGVVFFLSAPPTKPPTWQQRVQRARFTLCGQLWTQLPPATQAKWEYASKAAGLRCTGYNLFIHFQLVRNYATIRTVERLAHVSLIEF